MGTDLVGKLQQIALPDTFPPPSPKTIKSLDDIKDFYYNFFLWFKQFTPESTLEAAPLTKNIYKGPKKELKAEFIEENFPEVYAKVDEFFSEKLPKTPLAITMMLSPATMEWDGSITMPNSETYLREIFDEESKTIDRLYQYELRAPFDGPELYTAETDVHMDLDSDSDVPIWNKITNQSFLGRDLPTYENSRRFPVNLLLPPIW